MSRFGAEEAEARPLLFSFISGRLISAIDRALLLLSLEKTKGFSQRDEFVVSFTEEMLQRTRQDAVNGLFSPRVIGLTVIIRQMADEPERIIPCIQGIEALCSTVDLARQGRRKRSLPWVSGLCSVLAAVPWTIYALSFAVDHLPNRALYFQDGFAILAMVLSTIAWRRQSGISAAIGGGLALIWLLVSTTLILLHHYPH